VRISPTAYRRVCLASVWALGAIVLTGAAVRLTGSGLGCPDWPTCANDRIVAPVEYHAMVEFLNRLVTGAVSLVVIVAVGASLLRAPRRRDLTRWSLSLVGGVVAQIVIGGLVVKSGLSYSVVALHFLVSMALVAAAVVLVHRAGRPDDAPRPGRWPVWARAQLAAAVAILLTGPLVTSAGPHAGSTTRNGHEVPFKRLPIDVGWTARIHSTTVWIFVAGVVLLAWRTRRSDAVLHRRVLDLLVVTVAQGAIGYTQYFTGVPPLLVGLHVLGATLLWVMTLRLVLAAPEPVEAAMPVPAGAVVGSTP
jgi:cytochrome c oxidase assembly protein subunit 15